MSLALWKGEMNILINNVIDFFFFFFFCIHKVARHEGFEVVYFCSMFQSRNELDMTVRYSSSFICAVQ